MGAANEKDIIWSSIACRSECRVSIKTTPTVEQPIAPERPTKPIVITKTYGVNHHTDIITTESSCDEYIEIIKEKNVKIEALLKENARLKEEAQTGLQERLKKEYDKEMRKFENR